MKQIGGEEQAAEENTKKLPGTKLEKQKHGFSESEQDTRAAERERD